MLRTLVIAIIVSVVSLPAVAGIPASRYFYSGDGTINITSARGGASFTGRYRKPDGTYDPAAMRRISAVFGARYGDPLSTISPRLIEFLDYIQDHYNPKARISISSGFRSPEYNTSLRNNGKLAAKASLHQYGMAVDMSLAGVSSDAIWEFVKNLGFGGAGFYHGKLVHVDVGPARSWDEATSGVGTDISEENKLITMVTDKDIYLPGEQIEMRFIRMTAFPIGVMPSFTLERADAGAGPQKVTEFSPAFAAPASGSCPHLASIGEMLGIRWQLPQDIKPGRYRVRAAFCDKAWETMPADVATDAFEVIPR
ncbi:MAG: DUF882 domain-containing protein [bacterium]